MEETGSGDINTQTILDDSSLKQPINVNTANLPDLVSFEKQSPDAKVSQEANDEKEAHLILSEQSEDKTKLSETVLDTKSNTEKDNVEWNEKKVGENQSGEDSEEIMDILGNGQIMKKVYM